MISIEKNYTPKFSPKEITMKCCRFKEPVFNEYKGKQYHNYGCIIENCPRPLIPIKAKGGFTNIRRHFLHNHTNNNQEELDILVESIIGSESDKITGHYTKITEYEKVLFGILQYFMVRNHPLSDIEDPEYREISKFSKLYSFKMFKDVLKEISTIAEEKISEEMIEAKMGAFLQMDGLKVEHTF